MNKVQFHSFNLFYIESVKLYWYYHVSVVRSYIFSFTHFWIYKLILHVTSSPKLFMDIGPYSILFLGFHIKSFLFGKALVLINISCCLLYLRIVSAIWQCQIFILLIDLRIVFAGFIFQDGHDNFCRSSFWLQIMVKLWCLSK